MSARDKAIKAREALLNGSGKLSYFESRGLDATTVKSAWIGYDAEREAFTYPCIAKGGGLLGIHYKSEARNARGKRRQWWEGYADELPTKGHGKKPGDSAKIIPFGLETLEGLGPGSSVVLCCGEEDALSARQAGYTSVSQAGAGLLEPAYAKAFAGLEVVVFYNAGEEVEARKDALTLLGAGAARVRVVEWPNNAPHGADVNGRLVEDRDNFEEWLSGMIESAKPLASARAEKRPSRKGERDRYGVESETPSADEVRGDATEDSSRFSRNGHKPGHPPWPVLDDAALYGLPGAIVKAVEPHTEANPVAVLANLLVAAGNAVGRGAYVQVEADRHHLNLNAALVGETAKGRKGTSFGHVKQLMHAVDGTWAEDRILNGLSSGEGLISAVRDRVVSEDKNGDPVVVDPGVADKRLMVMEGEFGRVLKVMTRERNTLSAVIRAAWDGERLSTMTRNSPLKATGAHISVIGHITRAELLRLLSKTDTENGFANRFLWVLVRRSKVLPLVASGARST